jgi:hypothetical protein
MADQRSTPNEIIKTVTAKAPADGLMPPLVICFVNPDGAVLAVRSHPDRPLELLANNDVGHDAGLQGVGVLLDQRGLQRTWAMWKPKLN